MSHRSSVSALLCVFMLASLSMAGCLGSREWTYPPLPDMTYLDTLVAQPHAGSLAVFPLEDLRGTVVRDNYWKVAIPFVPYAVVAEHDRPETVPHPEPIDEVLFDPSSDIARAVAAEIRNANIFSSVTFHDGDHQQTPPNDFVLRGRLYSTRWARTLSTYLLGPFGTLAWMAGLPMGVTTTGVVMDVQLTSADDPSRVLWGFAMDFEGQVWDGAYYGLDESVIRYPQAVQEGLRPAMSDLVRAMSAHAQR